MNYYERHIGDYLKDTAHLSLLEHGIYGRLLDLYYTREGSLPAEQVMRLIGARAKEEIAAVGVVLREFFREVGDVWVQERCEREIERFQKKAAKNREVGKLGGRPRKTETHPVVENNHGGSETEPTENPLQSPVTSNQTPIEERDAGLAPSGPVPSARAPAPPDFLGDANESEIHSKARVLVAARWELPEAWGRDAEALGWAVGEILRESEKFRQYFVSGKGAGTRRGLKGWRQSWSNWLGKAEKFGEIKRVA